MRVDTNVTLICALLLIASICRSASTSPLLKDPFYGISPQDEKHYKTTGNTIKCKDGSKKFTKAQLNDDFCDCPDGSDEPGTSACPNGKMYCQNVGHNPLTIYSSRVNDGICDCCDGSDEYDGKVNCPNTCWEAGKVARDKLNKKIATYQEGVVLRKQEIEKAKVAIAKDEAELSKLKNEETILKGLVDQLKQRKEQIDKAEEKERLEKEKEEKEKREAEEANKPEGEAEQKKSEAEQSTEDDKTVPMDDPEEDIGNHDDDIPADQVEHVTSENVESPIGEAEQHSLEEHAKSKDDSAKSNDDSDHTSKLENDVPENTDGLSKEELGRLVASRWTGKNSESEDQTGKDGAAEDTNHEFESHDDTPKDSEEDYEEDDRYASDSDDDHTGKDDDDTGKYDEENLPDDNEESFEEEHDGASSYTSEYDDNSDSDTSSPSWLEKIQQTVRNLLQAVNLFQTPVDKSEAANIRKEYDESSAKLTKIQSRISSLTQKLKRDFGPEKEFYSLYGQCFESKQNKYVYKVCPYKQASQEEGHSTSRLGQWDKFENSYRVMVFSNGDKCWNGPDRSLKARLRCGLKNELTDIDEPSRCEYVALLSTPSVCVEEKLKELQEKRDGLMTEEPWKHDEL